MVEGLVVVEEVVMVEEEMVVEVGAGGEARLEDTEGGGAEEPVLLGRCEGDCGRWRVDAVVRGWPGPG